MNIFIKNNIGKDFRDERKNRIKYIYLRQDQWKKIRIKNI